MAKRSEIHRDILFVAEGREHTCYFCRTGGILVDVTVHHLNGDHGDNRLTNLVPCHGACHGVYHAHEAWASASRSRFSQGNKHSEETLAKMRAAASYRSPEYRAKMSKSLKGRTVSPEHRAKIRAANLGKTMPPEVRAKISAANKGKPCPPASVAATVKRNATRVSCDTCGRVMNPGALGYHQKASGHQGRTFLQK